MYIVSTRSYGKGSQIAGVLSYLVAVAPGEVLGANVLVGVLGALLQRRHVAPVLPVLVPEPVGVPASKAKGGDAAAVRMLRVSSGSSETQYLTASKQTADIDAI